MAVSVACRPCLWFTFLPPSPYPPSRREGGGQRFFYARGFAPCIPGGCTHGSPRKRQEAVPYEQRRQPRRGGTGGDGTIRRKRRRRLRWSSPPGQGEQVPQRGKPPAPRRVPERHPSPSRKGQSPSPGNTAAGSVSAARVQPRGCKGRSPLHKITLKSPPSRREGGRGDGGKNKAKVKGRRATKKARPPLGTRTAGRASAAKGQAPLPPPGTTAAGIASAA